MERHAFLGNSFEVVRLDDMAWLVLDPDLRTIQMGQDKVDACESLNQSDFLLKQQIGSFSLELLVRLLLDNNNHIAGFLTGVLVGFTVESVLGFVGGAFVDLGFNDLLLLFDLLALAHLALVGLVDLFSLAIAVVARTLGLRVHSRAKLGHAGDDTTSSASCALLDSAFFATFASARLADAVAVNSNLGSLAIVELLESALHWVHYWLALLWTGLLASATASEHAEEVVHASAATSAFFHSVFAVLVVKLSFFAVGENLVSALDFLELVFVTATIRVVLPGELEVSFLDLAEVSILLDAKDLVELGIVNLFGWASWTAHAAWHAFEVSERETTASTEEHFLVIFGYYNYSVIKFLLLLKSMRTLFRINPKTSHEL